MNGVILQKKNSKGKYFCEVLGLSYLPEADGGAVGLIKL